MTSLRITLEMEPGALKLGQAAVGRLSRQAAGAMRRSSIEAKTVVRNEVAQNLSRRRGRVEYAVRDSVYPNEDRPLGAAFLVHHRWFRKTAGYNADILAAHAAQTTIVPRVKPNGLLAIPMPWVPFAPGSIRKKAVSSLSGRTATLMSPPGPTV